jgi:hypothetical protein
VAGERRLELRPLVGPRLLAGQHLGVAAELDVGPRPAMLVAMVMAPARPAWATMADSCSW